ncbi:MAG: hypothetical protein WCB57_08735 [Pseudonocardiaceae bacterium]
MDNLRGTTQEVERSTAPSAMFVSLREQLDRIREWNEKRQWGLRSDDLDSIDLTPPTHSEPLVVDLIAVYLDGDGKLNGIRRTCHELWTVAAQQQPHTWSWDWYWDKWMHRPQPVRLIDGIVHRPGIRRVTVDLGAHFEPGRFISPVMVRGQDSAHAEVLAAAAHFPRWIRAMDGKTVPFTWVPGYEVMIRERPSPERLPALSWAGYRQSMSITADWIDHTHSGWASPTCLR